MNDKPEAVALKPCPSCDGLNISCPNGCGRDPKTGELNGTLYAHPPSQDASALVAALERIKNARPAGDYVLVREIETVTGDFCTEPGEPFYRIEIDGFCADFDYREAADNFAAAINARIAARPAVGEDVVERVRLVVMQELWKREQYNGVTADYNAFRDTMAGRIEKYEAEAERIARAAIAAMGVRDEPA